MDLGRLVSTISLGAALLAGGPADTAAQQTSQHGAETKTIPICPVNIDEPDTVETSIGSGIARSNYFFHRNGYDLAFKDTEDCRPLRFESTYDVIDSIVPDRTGYDAHDFKPDHDTSMTAMAREYRESIDEAYQAAMDTLDTLPASEEMLYQSELDLTMKAHPPSSAAGDTITIAPYKLWSDAVDKTVLTDQVTESNKDRFVTTEISRSFSHELLHTYDLPHPWDWKEPEQTKHAPFTNVMSYGLPRLHPIEGDQDGIFAYTMSDPQRALLDSALTEGTTYHTLQQQANLSDDINALRSHWEEHYPDVDKADYVGQPYDEMRQRWMNTMRNQEARTP